MQVMVNKEDLEAANEAIKALKNEIDAYFKLVAEMRERFAAQTLEMERLRARLSEFEVS